MERNGETLLLREGFEPRTVLVLDSDEAKAIWRFVLGKSAFLSQVDRMILENLARIMRRFDKITIDVRETWKNWCE